MNAILIPSYITHFEILYQCHLSAYFTAMHEIHIFNLANQPNRHLNAWI